MVVSTIAKPHKFLIWLSIKATGNIYIARLCETHEHAQTHQCDRKTIKIIEQIKPTELKIHSIKIYYLPMPFQTYPARASTMSTISTPIKPKRRTKLTKSCYIYLNEFYYSRATLKWKCANIDFTFIITWNGVFVFNTIIIIRSQTLSAE